MGKKKPEPKPDLEHKSRRAREATRLAGALNGALSPYRGFRPSDYRHSTSDADG